MKSFLVRLYRFLPSSIRIKILVAFSLLVLVSAATISLSSIYFGIRNGTNQAYDQLDSVASLKEAEIRIWLRNMQTDLLGLAEEGMFARISRILSTEEASAPFSSDFRPILERLSQVIHLTKRFDEIFILDRNGYVAASTDPIKTHEYRGLQNYFQKGLLQPGIHLQTVSFSSTSEGLNRIVAAYPVKDRGGDAVGVVCGLANMRLLNALMGERRGLGETGETYLVGSNGVLMTVSRFPGYYPVMTAVHTHGFTQALLNREQGQGTYLDYRGAMVLGVFRYLPELDAVLLAEKDRTEALSPIYSSLFFNSVVALATVLLSIVAALLLARGLSQPIVRLSRSAARIADGQLDLKVPEGRRDELGLLAKSFNHMTERLKESMTGLRISEEKYRSIFENAVEGIFQTSEAGRVLSANPAFARIFGYGSAKEMMDKVTNFAVQHYVDPEDRNRFVMLLRTQGEVVNFEARYLRRDGEMIWGSINARLIPGKGPRETLFEGIFQDITAQKLAEQEKNHLEEQLRQSQKMQAVGTLAGGISHEFNNLLQALSGQTQMLLMERDASDPDFTALSNISRTIERASDLVRRLLTFSRNSEPKVTMVDLRAVLDNSLVLLERTLPKMVDVRVKTASDIDPVMADPSQLEQIILNLAGNARDAMPKGGTLTFTLDKLTLPANGNELPPELESGPYIVLEVADTGTGIDKKNIDHVFEPFFTTKEIGKGTGLGLSIVYAIVKAHHGHITCESTPGRGTVFRLYFPAARAGKTQPSAGETVPGLALREGDETLLLVDDESMILEVASEVLRQLGYTVLLADTGEKAVRLFAENQETLDLVVMDLGMPGMGGEEGIRQMQRINARIPIIVASGYASHEIARTPRQYGVAGFLPKPYRIEQLAEQIRHILDRRTKRELN